MVARHGLHLLHEGIEPLVDIVFVHGLFGDPQKKWTGSSTTEAATHLASSNDTELNDENANITNQKITKGKRRLLAFWRQNKTKDEISETASQQASRESGVFWPKELLPKAIPQTRIYTWGYDVDINHVFSAASQATVFQHASALLSDIANKRTSVNEKRRPLIFIAHSLGGIIVKDMLNASRNEVTYLKDVLPSTFGIVFLGTPHRGSSIATIGKIAQEITKVLWKSPNISILRDLEVNSQTLDRVGRGFNQILVDHPIQIHSFREELPTNGIMIVNQFSSELGNGREILGVIPANHENMTKFSSSFDIGFIRIVESLSRWLDDIKSKLSDVSIDTELIGKQFADKLDDIHNWLNPPLYNLELIDLLGCRAANSQQHLFDQSVTRWFESDKGFLQITGDLGFGKTISAATIIE